MNISSVRITGISIHNFKNIIEGSLSFKNTRKDFKASVLGLYGQNGSGKTALIDALELLKYALCGQTIPRKFADFINIESEVATLLFDFEIRTADGITPVSYQFSIRSVLDVADHNIDTIPAGEQKKRVYIFNERIKSPIQGEKTTRQGTLIDTDTAELFLPRAKKQLLVGSSKQVDTNLQVAKKLSGAQSRSFIFSRKFLDALSNAPNQSDTERQFYVGLLQRLVMFGNLEFFVINTTHSGLMSLNAQSLVFAFKSGELGSRDMMTIPLNEPVVIPTKEKEVIVRIIQTMNGVLEQVVPGLTIHHKNLGTQIMESGEEGTRIQLMSRRNNKDIPLSYESEGIKKIISILQLLIVMYNQPSITVAIDDLDSGVFEYLLGELLTIISERGKGQLIFTSHNLRPLETLDRGFIAFTTTNPKNRYVRMVNVKENNNLRGFYFRDIVLGGQDEELYDQTNNAEIAYAFREAGEYCGS